MTVDELVSLTEALLADSGLTLEALRYGGGHEAVTGMDDEQFVLAIRFLAGERPVDPSVNLGRMTHDQAMAVAPPLSASQRRRTGAERYLDDRRAAADDTVAQVDEGKWAEKLAEIEALDESIEPVDVDLGDGVTLFG